jgi:hypothetical protein
MRQCEAAQGLARARRAFESVEQLATDQAGRRGGHWRWSEGSAAPLGASRPSSRSLLRRERGTVVSGPCCLCRPALLVLSARRLLRPQVLAA